MGVEEGVTAGSHLLHVRKAGFTARTFNLEFTPGEDRRDLGVVRLEAGLGPTATLSGRVTDGPSGRPLQGAVVELNGDIVTRTDSRGAFSVSDVPIAWGGNEIKVEGVAYPGEASEFWRIYPDETFDFAVILDPAPIELDGVMASVTPTLREGC